MTPTELREARHHLGYSTAALARRLKLGENGGRTVRRWEAGDRPISGPVEVAIGLMLADEPAQRHVREMFASIKRNASG